MEIKTEPPLLRKSFDQEELKTQLLCLEMVDHVVGPELPLDEDQVKCKRNGFI